MAERITAEGRLRYQVDDLDKPKEQAKVDKFGYPVRDIEHVDKRTPNPQGNLVSSKTFYGMHMPVLDIDVPHELLPSSTPGNSHLYLNVPISWFKYKVLLRVLKWCNILEPGYVKASIKKGATFVRAPGVYKVKLEVEAPQDE